jgi:hypothetical protein
MQLYLVHWPVAFQQGDDYFPLVADSTIEGGDVIIDDGVSIVETWDGRFILGLPLEKMLETDISQL